MDDSDSIHGFYDFDPSYNEETNPDLGCAAGWNKGIIGNNGFGWMEKMPSKGLKRVWVRPL